jgi:hypothetical protein
MPPRRKPDSNGRNQNPFGDMILNNAVYGIDFDTSINAQAIGMTNEQLIETQIYSGGNANKIVGNCVNVHIAGTVLGVPKKQIQNAMKAVAIHETVGHMVNMTPYSTPSSTPSSGSINPFLALMILENKK